MIVFVGDKPSRLNEHYHIPFIGTPSWKNLLRWIDKLKVAEYHITNSFDHEDKITIRALHGRDDTVFVALGNEASWRLHAMDIFHFKLPHPSPRNRLLNDSSHIDSELQKCYLYLKEHSECVKFVTTGNPKK